MENIKKNRALILSKINNIHKASFFSKRNIPKLVAVSKKQDDYKIDLSIASGQRIFGENRVQEAIDRWTNRIEIHRQYSYQTIPLFRSLPNEAPCVQVLYFIECAILL